MTTITKRLLLLVAFALSVSAVFAQDSGLSMNLIGQYHTGFFDKAGAEISAFDPATQQLFFTNAEDNSVVVLDITDPSNPTVAATIDMSTYGGGVNSVAVYNGIVAIAVEANIKTDNGSVVFFEAASDFSIPTANVAAGALPDMITFTHDGTKVLVANEGEPNDDYDVDPEGSVTIIDLSSGVASASPTQVTFTSFNAQETELKNAGVRIFGPGATVAQDFEPEYIGLSADDATAFVSLQENNALAVIDVASATVTAIWPLGFKDHTLPGNELDASNDDDAINIVNWPLKGMYLPDAISTFNIDGTDYIFTANEGDSRDYDGFSEEARVKDLRLNEAIFTDPALQEDENLGRIKITTTMGINPDSVYLYTEMESGNELPEVDSDAAGAGEFFLNATEDTLFFAFYVDGLDFGEIAGGDSVSVSSDDDVTGIHFHVGDADANGGVVFNIGTSANTTFNLDSTETWIEGYWAQGEGLNGSDLADFVAVMKGAAFEEEINLYVNIHTAANPAGEIRGQLWGDPMYDELYSYGARSFSIWNGTDGSLVFDSGSEFENLLAEFLPDEFNSDNTENDTFDGRSDDKGPEPEAITVIKIAGHVYAMIGLERVGGVMVYDVTDPANAAFVGYANDRDFSVAEFNEDDIDGLDEAGVKAVLEAVVASGPESITFIKQGASPLGNPLAVVSNESTGSITISEIEFESMAAPLLFSEYAEGSSNNKYLEIYNPTADSVDLTDYAYPNMNNGLDGNNQNNVAGEFDFWNNFADGAKIAPYGIYIVAHPSAADTILAKANETNQFLSNGDDAFALAYGTEDDYVILDIIGDLFADPGSGWEVAGVTNGTQNHTLVRKPEIMMGNAAPQGSFGTDEFDSEWEVLAQDNFTNLGKRSTDEALSLTIFHNNDGESQLIDLGGDLTDFGGVARFATLLEMYRDTADAKTDGSIFLSSGDNFLAGPEFTAGVSDGIFYDAVAIAKLGYDALALGNHDFDFGPETTAEFISTVGNYSSNKTPTYLSANLNFENEESLQSLKDAGRIASSSVVEVNGQLVGIIGATTPNLPFISSPRGVEVDVHVKEVVQAEIDKLQAGGINKIILISHLQGIEEDSLLATELSGVDVMIAGGGDELLANDGDLLIPGDEEDLYGSYPIEVVAMDGATVPIVTTRGNYSYLGRLIVNFDMDGNLTGVSDESGPIRVAGGAEPDSVSKDAELMELVVAPVEDYLADLASNVIATTDVELDGVRNSVRGKETNLGNLISDAFLAVAQDRAESFGATIPMVALQNGGGIRNGSVLPVGNLTELETFNILPFGNFLSVVEGITPERFKAVMENAVAFIDAESGLPAGAGTGRFAQVAGFVFTYDLMGTPRMFDEEGNVTEEGTRVIDIMLNDGQFIVKDGMIVKDAPTVALATGSFTAAGGDQYPFSDLNSVQLGITDQQSLAMFLESEEYLAGEVLGEDYPFGGEGRHNIIGSTSIYDARMTDPGIRVTLEGVVIRPSGRIARLVDETGATAIYDYNGTFRDSVESGFIKEGDLLRVTGSVSPYNGLHEISNVESFKVMARENPLPPAVPATLEDIAENGEWYESNLVIVYDVEIDTDDTVFTAGRTYTLVDNSDVTLRVQSASGNESAQIVGTKVPQGKFNFVGTLGQYDSSEPRDEGYQLLPVFPSDFRMGGFTLTLLHNNDGESQIVNLGSGLEDFGGVARFKALVDRERNMEESKGNGVLMLSSGDNFLAGPEYTVGVNDSVFYDAIAVDAIGYDALSFGNHDFDFGPQVTFDFVKQIESIFLSANLDVTENDSLSMLYDEDQIAAGAIFEINGQDVGIVGAITPNLPFISSPGDVTVEQDVAASVQEIVDLFEGEGVNKIILISHLQGVAEDSALATQLSGVDVMIAGGGDDLLANDGNLLIPGDVAEAPYPMYATDADNKPLPIVTTAGNYSYLGKLVINFDAEGNITEVLDGSGPIRVAGGNNPDAVMPDPFLQEYVVKPVQAGLSVLAANVITNSEVPLQGGSNVVRAKETNTGNIVTDAYLWAAAELAPQYGAPVPQIAIANGGGIRNGEIPAGEITELNTFDILAFLNFLTVVENVTPEQLKLILENAVSRIVLVEGEPQRSGDGTGRFAQIAGFSFNYNATLDPLTYDENGVITFDGERVIDVTLDDGTAIIKDGHVVDGAPTVSLATADFTARGGDQYPFNESNELTLLGKSYQQTLYDYMVASTNDGGLGGQITAAQYPVDGNGRITLTDRTPTAAEIGSDLPTVYNLDQNYPNPFNPSTQIQFALPENASVNLTVFNMLGQKVMTLVNGKMEAGYHSVRFDASALASGMYIYRIQAGEFVSTKKMMLIK